MTETARHHTVQTPQQVTFDLLSRLPITGGGLVAVIILAILGLAGAVRLILLAMSGPQGGAEPYANFGYAAAVLAFLMSTAQAAPVLSFASRLAKGFWGIPVRRAADLLSISGLVTTPLFIVLLFQLPDFTGRPSIWNDWPGSPRVYDAIGICLITFCGLAILYVTSLPDLAAARDTRGSGLARALSLGWRGTKRQWDCLTTGTILLGAFYLMWYAYVNMFLISDLGMSLVPGWHSSLMPAYHTVTSLEAGCATAMVTLYLLRRFANLERFVGVDAFWGTSKIFLGLALLFFYFTWAEFNPTWYGRTPAEQGYLGVLEWGPFLPLFVISFMCNFILPFALLMWNPVRVSIKGVPLVGALVMVGIFVDRLRIFLASWEVAGPVGQEITVWPAVRIPQLGDIAIVVGAIAASVCLYLLALRVIPPVSLWEYKQALLLRVEREFLKTEVAVVAKPR